LRKVLVHASSTFKEKDEAEHLTDGQLAEVERLSKGKRWLRNLKKGAIRKKKDTRGSRPLKPRKKKRSSGGVPK